MSRPHETEHTTAAKSVSNPKEKAFESSFTVTIKRNTSCSSQVFKGKSALFKDMKYQTNHMTFNLLIISNILSSTNLCYCVYWAIILSRLPTVRDLSMIHTITLVIGL